MRNGDFPQACDVLRQVLATDPDDAVAQMLYGTCRRIMGDSDSFVRVYRRLEGEMSRCVERGGKSERTRMWMKYAAMFTAVFMFVCPGRGVESGPSGEALDAMAKVGAQATEATRGEGRVEKDDAALYRRVMAMPLKESRRGLRA